jgi:hypothetical protein
MTSVVVPYSSVPQICVQGTGQPLSVLAFSEFVRLT